jgi:riboflavin kinase/FMN adenylyltransferase
MPQFITSREWTPNENTIISVGAFDGIHRGHRMIIEKMISESRKTGLKTLLFTFHPHPKKILSPSEKLELLTVFEEKKILLGRFDLDYVLFYPFNISFARLTGKDFLELLKEKYKVRKLLLGYNHTFGNDRLYDDRIILKTAEQLDFNTERLPVVEIDRIPVSSSTIRRRIKSYDIKTANKLLGYDYLMLGKVVHGSRFGRKIGFPTANLEIPDNDKLIPPPGVYFVKVSWDASEKYGVMNIGNRPTIDGKKTVIEVHILDFSGDLYGKNLCIRFLEFFRKEKAFPGIEPLKEQIRSDVEKARKIIENQ